MGRCSTITWPTKCSFSMGVATAAFTRTRFAGRRFFGVALPGPAPSTGGAVLTSQTCSCAVPPSALLEALGGERERSLRLLPTPNIPGGFHSQLRFSADPRSLSVRGRKPADIRDLCRKPLSRSLSVNTTVGHRCTWPGSLVSACSSVVTIASGSAARASLAPRSAVRSLQALARFPGDTRGLTRARARSRRTGAIASCPAEKDRSPPNPHRASESCLIR